MKKLIFFVLTFTAGMGLGLAIAAAVAVGMATYSTPPSLAQADTSRQPDISVMVSEQHINAIIGRNAAGLAGFTDVGVRVERGNVLVLAGNANIAGFRLPVQVKARISVDGDTIKLHTFETRAGMLPLNLDLTEAIAEPVQNATKSALPLDRYRVSQVTTQAGSITVALVER